MTSREQHRQRLLDTIHQWMRRRGFWFVFALAFSSMVPSTAFAAVKPAPAELVKQEAAAKAPANKAEERKIKHRNKSVEGAVMFIRKDRMSVEFSQNGEEGGEDILLSLDKKIKLKKAKDLSEIRPGDKVRVKYVETYLEPQKKGQSPIILSMVGTEIELLKKANPEALSS